MDEKNKDVEAKTSAEVSRSAATAPGDSSLLRFVKGAFIGSGFILPGVSGGALAAVFGIYEHIIGFFANLTKDFKRRFMYLLPVGLGAVAGIILLSFAVSFFLEAYTTYVLWFFIGCIVGTLPTLWKQAGQVARKPRHLLMTAASFALMTLFLVYGQTWFSGSLPQNFLTWMMAGALIGLGTVVPGMSPSNFLLYLGMYKPMTDGIKSLDLMVILPLLLGCLLCIILFSKLMEYIFNHAHAGMFHLIFGIVLASTVMIVPVDYNYLGWGTLFCILCCAAGIALGYWMSHLEEKYK